MCMSTCWSTSSSGSSLSVFFFSPVSSACASDFISLFHPALFVFQGCLPPHFGENSASAVVGSKVNCIELGLFHQKLECVQWWLEGWAFRLPRNGMMVELHDGLGRLTMTSHWRIVFLFQACFLLISKGNFYAAFSNPSVKKLCTWIQKDNV